MSSIIEVDKLNYKNIFKNFSISIPENEFITISGTNKCGKTTLLKILSRDIKINNSIIYNKIYLESYTNNEIYNEIEAVIPSNEINFIFNTVEDELVFVLDNLGLSSEDKVKRLRKIVKVFKINKYMSCNPNNLHRNLRIKVEMALATIAKPKILLLDDVCSVMSKDETKEILDIIKYFKEEENMTIVMTTDNLSETIDSDYLYILRNGKIALEGKPKQILKEDNTINKIGLNLPFMVDLSVKLKDYDLIDDIGLDMDELVNKLWK